MSTTIVLPREFPYVLLAATSTLLVSNYAVALVELSRTAAGIKYPITYASEEAAAKDLKAAKFNCCQRAHANYTENLTPILASILISGLRMPLTATGLGVTWSIFRILYTRGYSTGVPENRAPWSLVVGIVQLVLPLLAGFTGVKMMLEM